MYNKQLDTHQQVARDLLNDLEESIVTKLVSTNRRSVSWRGKLGDVIRQIFDSKVRQGRCYDGGLYLHGGVGRGKTMLMDTFFAKIADRVVAKRFHYHDFMKLIHEAFYHQRKNQSDQGILIHETVNEILGRDCRLLCLDEMEVIDITDAMLMVRLFKELIDRGLVIVITSNVGLRYLYKDGLQRDLFVPFIEMMEEYVHSFFLGRDHDYRENGGETKSWFCGSVQETQVGLQALYENWQAEGSKVSLRISLASRGRFMEAKRRKGNKVWFDFFALCGDPLGGRDFIKLASTFGYMIIEGIPRADNLRVDALRRFVVLVDILYDEGVKIGMSSTSGSETLDIQTYLEREDGDRYGLSRAVSRLQEML